MKVAVIGIDSSIGAALAAHHEAKGDTVIRFSRKPGTETTRWFDLTQRQSWTRPIGCDRIYYLIRGNSGNESTDVALGSIQSVRYLQWLSDELSSGEIVVFSSTMGSIASIHVPGDIPYRMMKAALNMGVRCLSMRTKGLKWLLVNPGLVYTKATQESLDAGTFLHGSNPISAEQAAQEVDNVVTSGKYSNGAFVDTHLDKELPW